MDGSGIDFDKIAAERETVWPERSTKKVSFPRVRVWPVAMVGGAQEAAAARKSAPVATPALHPRSARPTLDRQTLAGRFRRSRRVGRGRMIRRPDPALRF